MKKTLIVTTLTVLFSLFISSQAMAVNLVGNGDFETPIVNTSQLWDIYDSGTAGLGWSVEWAGTYLGAPSPAHLELHRGVNGWLSYEGSQYAELDTDWDGPGGSMSGEQASVKIYQDIETCIGGKFELSYAWSPRPNQEDNEIKVYWDGNLIATHSGNGGSNTNWTPEVYSDLIVTGASTELAFVETGNPDSLGMFIDAVSVEQTSPCDLGCTLTQGYWKTHSEYGPAPYDDGWVLVGEDTPFFLSGQSYYEVLWTAPEGNAYYILAHQYIAAKLNAAYMPTEIQDAFDEATVLFGIYTPDDAAAWKGKNEDRKEFISLAEILNDYNNGLIGPGHCDEQEEEYEDLTGTWLLSVNDGTYMHDMFITTQNQDGSFSGNGGYPAGSGPTYPDPYNWTMTGQLTGDSVTFTLYYQNTYTATLTGTVNVTFDYMSGGAGTGGVYNWSATRI